MILLKRQYTIGGQVLSIEPPADPNLLPGYTYRDVMPQGDAGSPPIYAVNHIFDFSSIITDMQQTFSPNLGLKPGVSSSIVFNTGGQWTTCSLNVSNNNTTMGFFTIASDGSGDLYGFIDNNWMVLSTHNPNDLYGWDRYAGGVRVVKYSGGVQTVLHDYGNVYDSNILYPCFKEIEGYVIKYLQYSGDIQII